MSWIDGHRSKIELKRTPLQYIEKYEKNKEPQSAKNKIEQKMHHIGSSHFQCKTIISYLCSYDKKKEFLFLFVHRAEDQREWNSERQQQQQHAKKMLYEHNIKYKYSNRFQQSLKHVLFYAFAV